ncbi:MAG: sulfotransferase domain-containing protein, partial [Desulfobulbaceae bacterium]|nr:sulfotransferase domain-containing protein [Desulfobulbaceae bacterium]
RRLGYVELSFDDIVFQRSGHPLSDLYYQQTVSLGMYYEQVKRYLDIFGKKKVKIILNEELRANTPGVVRSLFAFLGVDASFEPALTKHHNVYGKPRNGLVRYFYTMKGVRSATKKIFPAGFAAEMKKTLLIPGEKPAMNREAVDHLSLIYKEDIVKLAAFIKRDLSHWFR